MKSSLAVTKDTRNYSMVTFRRHKRSEGTIKGDRSFGKIHNFSKANLDLMKLCS
jgi:hypothetical protein